MSEHTKHTPWPLKVGGRSREWNSPMNPREDITALSPHGTTYRFGHINYPSTTDGYVGAEERKENARRFVACWNAAIDVPTEILEKIASGEMEGSEVIEYYTVKRQRDRLLEALRPFAALLQEHNNKQGDSRPVFAINDAQITVGDLRASCAVIAEVEAAK